MQYVGKWWIIITQGDIGTRKKRNIRLLWSSTADSLQFNNRCKILEMVNALFHDRQTRGSAVATAAGYFPCLGI